MAPTITDATLSDTFYASNGVPNPVYFTVRGRVTPGHAVQIVDASGQVPFGRSYTTADGYWSTEFVGFGANAFNGLREYRAVDTVTGEESALTGVFVAATPGATVAGPTLGETITGPSILIGYPATVRIGPGSSPGGENTFLAYTVAPDASGNHASGADVVVHGGYRSTVVLPVGIDELTGHRLSFLPSPGQFNLTLETADARIVMDQDVTRLRFDDVTVTVQTDPLVDFLFYDMRYADVAALDLNVRAHYDGFGWREGRDPNAYFSTSGYLSAYGDVRTAGINPLLHYDTDGWRDGRDPSIAFDTSLYLRFNPDVAAAGIDPLRHFLVSGQGEGRQAYATIGSESVRDGFDPIYYLLANPDVGLAGADARTHFAAFGSAEARDPNAYFDTSWYLEQNPDVRASGAEALAHYQAFGWREGRDPSARFDTSAYLAANPDVAAAEISPLQHFLQFGAMEGRSASGDVL